MKSKSISLEMEMNFWLKKKYWILSESKKVNISSSSSWWWWLSLRETRKSNKTWNFLKFEKILLARAIFFSFCFFSREKTANAITFTFAFCVFLSIPSSSNFVSLGEKQKNTMKKLNAHRVCFGTRKTKQQNFQSINFFLLFFSISLPTTATKKPNKTIKGLKKIFNVEFYIQNEFL